MARTSIIASVAYFKMCPEGNPHGHVVLADGRRGVTVGSKKAARKQAESFRRRGLVAQDELLVLREQIEDAALPEELPPELEIAIAMIGVEDIFNANPAERDSFDDIFPQAALKGSSRTLH